MLVVSSALCALLVFAPVGAAADSAMDAVHRQDPGAQVGLVGGRLSSVRLSDAAALPAPAGTALEDHAARFLRRFGPAFGLRDPDRELGLDRVDRDALGFRHLRYGQRVGGVPVFGAALRVHVDAATRVRTIEGLVLPDLTIDPTPRIGPELAAEHARARVAEEAPGDDLETLDRGLWAFRTDLARGPGGTDHLAWRVEVRGHATRSFAFVDAHTGKVVEVQRASDRLTRRVYDGRLGGTVLWQEGSTSLPEPGTDVASIVDASLATYDLYRNMSGGRLSYDALDGIMLSVASVRATDCPNAYWDGVATNFCSGVAGDDGVAHEWSHAYTEYTDDLAYVWQPGALNEAYSDIFGETVDLVTPGDGPDDVVRGNGLCSSIAGASPPLLVVTQPASVAGTSTAGPALFGPRPSDALPLSGALVLADDASGADRNDACEPLVGQSPYGNVVLMRRGNCLFTEKVQSAQDAGAIAAVVFNDQGEELLTMAGDAPGITIPAIFVAQSVGEALAAASSPLVTLEVTPLPTGSEASYRWLIGEDSVAFGGAVRDLWAPGCLGAPGKVSDATYACSTDDGGGVHANSTVASHAYALLVDGGSYNGVTVGAIGLDRAAQIYWRAKVYQGPYTGFAEHAQALDLACQDLVGTTVPALATGNPSADPPVDDAVCQQVAAAEQAVELRSSPGQCNFQPLLAPDAPALCQPFATILSEDFETDTGWQVQSHGVYPEFNPVSWQRRQDLPAGGSGWAYYAPATDVGDCTPHSNDQAGAFYLTSPELSLPAGAGDFVLAFRHYVATETNVDGGVVRVSVDGGPFQPLAQDAFTFNGYDALLMGAQAGNDNPLAGAAAFSGTDGGVPHGSWGESQVSLAKYVHGGQRVRVQFVLGVDGCGGLDGWYVDDVRLVSCGKAVAQKGGCAELPSLWSAVGAMLALAGARVRRRRL